MLAIVCIALSQKDLKTLKEAVGRIARQRRLRRGQRSLPRYISKKTAMRAASRRGPRISLERFVSSAASSIEGGAAAPNSS